MRNPWEWRRGNNLYKWNAFTLIKASPGDVSLKTVNQKIKRMELLIRRAPEKPKVFGRQVQQADITRSSQILFSPNERMLEELLCHRPHSLDLARFEEHTAYFSQLPVPPVKKEVLPQITNLGALCTFLPKPKPREFSPSLLSKGVRDRDVLREEIVFRI